MLITDIKPIARSSEEIEHLEKQATAHWTDRIGILRGDLLAQNRVDAIVNAANQYLVPGGGLSGQIHSAAGPQLARFCKHLVDTVPGGIREGRAYTTHGGLLDPINIIHAIGARWDDERTCVEKTWSAYMSTVMEADKYNFRVIALPLLGSGLYGWPLDKAVETALHAVGEALTERCPNRVVFVSNNDTHYNALRTSLDQIRREEDAPFI